MGPILAIYPTVNWQEDMKCMLFCHLDLSQHKKWMPPAPNLDGLPICRHFQNGRQWSKILFSHITQHIWISGLDKDKILVFKPMFFWMMNPMMTQNPYNSWLTRNSKWLSLKPVEIIWIGPWAQRTPYASAMNTYNLFYFVTEINPNMKSGCHHHQIGMYYLMTPSFKFTRLIHHY